MQSDRAVPEQTSTPTRITEAITKIASVLRAENWSAAGPVGLNPAQADILQLVAQRSGGGVRQSWIAHQLGVSAATTSDSVTALVRKGLVDKIADPGDGRVSLVRVTVEGHDVLERLQTAPSLVASALDRSDDDEQGDLLAHLLILIGRMQATGRFPETRACVSCVHFGARPRPSAAHRCLLLDMPLPDTRLRIDCPEHEMLPVHAIAGNVEALVA